jgi:hypothetical protein
LKDIASFLDSVWGEQINSGIDCIASRLRWERSRDPVIKEAILEYNRQDCLAVKRVADFLISLGNPAGEMKHEVRLTAEIAAESHKQFGKIEFAIPEMSFINQCARFNYQRDKVLLRTYPEVRASVRRQRASSRRIQRPNVEIQCEPAICCPGCGGTRFTTQRSYSDSKLVYDVKFTRSGVKRWVIKYSSRRYECLDCHKTFFPKSYPTNQKVGPALASWAVHQHVALRQSFGDITLNIKDITG